MSKPVLTGILVALVVALIGVGVYSIFANRPSTGAPAAAPSSAPAAPPALVAAQTPLGTVVTDKDGFTLYRFDKDTPKPPDSTCAGNCATTWPPVPALDANPQVEGVDPALIGSVDRADGTQQLTLNGWPLYRYSKDVAAGDTKGEGVGGTWHAVGVDGKPAKAAAAGPSSKASSPPASKKPAPPSGRPSAGASPGY